MADIARQGARDPDVLQREIERTREELSRTIDAIVDRVSPTRIARRGIARVKENAGYWCDTVHDAFGSTLIRGETHPVEPPEGLAGDVRTTTYRVLRAPVPTSVLIAAGVAVVAVAAYAVWRHRRDG